MRVFALICAIVLSGCAIGKGVRQVGATKRNMYEAKCNGMARTIADCYEQADNICGEQGLEAAPIGQDSTSNMMRIGNGYTPIANRSLMFKCVAPTESASN